MQRSIRTFLVLCALTPAACLAETNAAPAAGASTGASTACQTRDTTYDSRDVTCALPAGQAWEFKADFTGGHDDTLATMTVLVDDKPAACDGGGKLRLFGEDGFVSLHCRVAGAPAGAVLKANIKYSHCEYAGAHLKVD